AAALHQDAALALATIVRNNADARIARANLDHHAVELAHAGDTKGADEAIAASAANVARVTADETAVKRRALDDAQAAVAANGTLRSELGAALDATRGISNARAQAYRDALASAQVQAHGAVAELAADIDPAQARTHLE